MLSRDAPQEQALFPQDFRVGEASPEELVQHLELANWTISALEQTIKAVGGEEASRIKNLYDATGGIRIVLQRHIDDEKV